MHERRNARDECVAVEDVLDREILDDEFVDDAYLREALAEPGRYLPPPSVQASREPEPTGPDPEPEHPIARRVKLAALVVATAMVIASIVVAAIVTGESDDTAAQSLHSASAPSSVSFFTVTQPF